MLKRPVGSTAGITGSVMLLLVAAVWGATLSFTRSVLDATGLEGFLVLRFAAAALFLIPFLPFTSREGVNLKGVLVCVPMGVLLYAIFYYQSAGLLTVNAAATGFITGSNVVMVPLVAYILFRAKVARKIWLAIMVTVVGLAIVAGSNLFSPHLGVWQVLFSALLIAVDIVLVERVVGWLDPLWFAFGEVVVAFLAAGAGFFLSGNALPPLPSGLLSIPVASAVVFNGVLGTSLALWAENYYQVIVPSSQVAVIFSTEPIFAALIAGIFFGNAIASNVIIGGTLVLAGVVISDLDAYVHNASKVVVAAKGIVRR